MSFLYPSFLFALALLAVPIIIHFFDLQRSEKVYFTNMGVLKNITERTTSSRKIRHFLVLLSRILFILCMVLAFSQPMINSKENNKSSVNQNAFYFDNSQSMQNGYGNGNLLDLSVQNATKLAELFPDNTKFIYLDNNLTTNDNVGISNEKFKDKVSEIKFSNNAQSFENVYRRLESQLLKNGNNAAKNIFWFSDFQKSTFGDITKIKVDTNINIYLLPIQNQETSNFFIDSLWLDNYFVRPGEINKISVKIRNSGGAENAKIKLKLFVDNIQSANTSVDVATNSFEIVYFDIKLTDNNLKKCRIELDDNNIKFDNQYFFTLQPTGIINILEVSEGKTNFIKNVYANEQNFVCVHNKFGNISLADLEKSQLIVVNELDKLNISEAKNLKSYIENGGSLLLFPSNIPDPKKLDEIINVLQIPNVTIGLTNQTPSAIKFPDTKNPFFENVFEKIDKNTDMPIGAATLTIGTKGMDLLIFNTGLPFLTNFKNKKGEVTICSSPLIEPFTTFQKHAIFVPVMYKFAIGSSKIVSKPAYNFSAENVAVKITDNQSNDVKYSINKEKFTYIPEQRKREGNLYFDMPGMSLDPGFYEIKRGDSLVSTLAFNYESKESQMSFYTTKQLKELFINKKNIQCVENDVDGKFVGGYNNTHFGIALWKYFIIAALFFLLIEIVLLRLK